MTDPTSMLSGLSDIDWASHNHAQGEASDVPTLLFKLSSPKGEHRGEALELFLATLLNEGFVYDATVAAIPFLAELAQLREHVAAPLAAFMLALIADAQRPPDLEWADAPNSARPAGSDPDPDPDAEWLAGTRAAWDGCREALAVLAPCMRDHLGTLDAGHPTRAALLCTALALRSEDEAAEELLDGVISSSLIEDVGLAETVAAAEPSDRRRVACELLLAEASKVAQATIDRVDTASVAEYRQHLQAWAAVLRFHTERAQLEALEWADAAVIVAPELVAPVLGAVNAPSLAPLVEALRPRQA